MRFKNNALLVNTVEKGLDSFRGLGLVFYYLKTLQPSCAKVKHGSSISFSSLPLEEGITVAKTSLRSLQCLSSRKRLAVTGAWDSTNGYWLEQFT